MTDILDTFMDWLGDSFFNFLLIIILFIIFIYFGIQYASPKTKFIISVSQGRYDHKYYTDQITRLDGSCIKFLEASGDSVEICGTYTIEKKDVE